MKKFAKINQIDRLAYLAIFIFIVIFIVLSFGRHDALKSYQNDIGMYDQVIWNTVHGHPFQLSSGMNGEPNLLASRFSLILIFFVPFYVFLASPKWLLLFQAISIGASAIPIYLFAKEKLKNSKWSLVFLGSYLFYPALHNGLLYDFHEVVFAVGFAAWAFYFLEKKNDKAFIIFAVLLAMSQEFLVLPVFMMGLYLIFIKKRIKFGIIVSVLSIGYFLIAALLAMPHFSAAGKHGLLESNNGQYTSYYSWLGSSFPEIIKNIILHPLTILNILLSHERKVYLFILILPVFSLAIYAWPIVVIFPVVLIYLLSANSMTYNIYFYHAAIIAPFVYFSAAEVYRRWFFDNLNLRRLFAFLILAPSVIVSVLFSVSPLSPYYTWKDYMPGNHAKNLSKVEALVPKDAEISIQHNLGPHFSEREKLYIFPMKYDKAEYVILDTTNPYLDNPKQLFKFDYALQDDLDDWKGKIDELKKSQNHSLIYDADGYLIFKKINRKLLIEDD